MLVPQQALAIAIILVLITQVALCRASRAHRLVRVYQSDRVAQCHPVQKGLSLIEFQRIFGSEEQCEAALEKTRWPAGFRCPRCDGHDCQPCTHHQKCHGDRGLCTREPASRRCRPLPAANPTRRWCPPPARSPSSRCSRSSPACPAGWKGLGLCPPPCTAFSTR